MRIAYRVLAHLVAIGVAVQAAAMVYAIAGLGIWVDGGGVLDKAAMEADEPFPEVVGFAVHGINGMMVIPLIALLLLITSFFARVAGAVKWAVIVLVLVVVQVALGLFGHEVSGLGALHGLNALLLFASALQAGRVARKPAAPVESPAPAESSVSA
jgi:hypothetical protein